MGDKDIMDFSQRNLIKTQDNVKIDVDIDEDTFEHDFNDDKSKDNSIIGAKKLQNIINKPKISQLYEKEIPNNASKSDDDVGRLGNCAKYGCSDCEFKTNDKKDLIFHIRKRHTLNL